MRQVYLLTLILVFIWVDVMVIDHLRQATTTDEQKTAALTYLEEQELAEPIKHFHHDGCTLFPDTLPFHDFRDACLQHDYAYWAGGTSEHKHQADMRFYEDLKNSGPLGALVFAPIMHTSSKYLGDSFLVRLVGTNWGYGWNR